eukprot:CAMPEP_0185829352 /NCGR_PEP_ID=MMETSP1353-20130828/200_1 /TAXON_ID=1077150 /ORGANISM="Erythrolobus australicus, Strain CCMP3124" /LENGTH=557 /DNA_ID=CAMNT_0028527135 /DNA_START=349 /DNA_END=2022 /DNA_ORIENTATION=-
MASSFHVSSLSSLPPQPPARYGCGDMSLKKRSLLRASLKEPVSRRWLNSGECCESLGSSVSIDSLVSRERSLKFSAPDSPFCKTQGPVRSAQSPTHKDDSARLKSCVGLAVSCVERVADAAQLAALKARKQQERLRQSTLENNDEADSSDTDINLNIMHTRVPDTLFIFSVVQSATVDQLARKFNISHSFVKSMWITSEEFNDKVDSFGAPGRQGSTEHVVHELSEDQRRRYHERLSSPVSPRELAQALSQLPSSSQDEAESRTTLRRPECGFSSIRKHIDVALADGNAVASKANPSGLFRSVQAEAALCGKSSNARRAYAEFRVLSSADANGDDDRAGKDRTLAAGGLCVGVATDKLAANKMPGMASESVGLYATGDLVLGCKHNALGDHAAYDVGDVVGVLVEIDEDDADVTGACGSRQVTFFVNGLQVASTSLVMDKGLKLYPTASLYHPGKSIALVCCAENFKHATSVLSGGACDSLCGQSLRAGESAAQKDEPSDESCVEALSIEFLSCDLARKSDSKHFDQKLDNASGDVDSSQSLCSLSSGSSASHTSSS